MSGFEAMLAQPESVRTQPMGEVRKSVLRKLGASPRFTVRGSQDPNAGRAAYATCNTPAGGFFVLYAGTWKQIKSDRMYTGVSSYVVEVNGWRIHPPAPAPRHRPLPSRYGTREMPPLRLEHQVRAHSER